MSAESTDFQEILEASLPRGADVWGWALEAQACQIPKSEQSSLQDNRTVSHVAFPMLQVRLHCEHVAVAVNSTAQRTMARQ